MSAYYIMRSRECPCCATRAEDEAEALAVQGAKLQASLEALPEGSEASEALGLELAQVKSRFDVALSDALYFMPTAGHG